MASETAPNQGATGPDPVTGGQSPLDASRSDDDFARRPEVYVGGAFVGGLALALIIRAVGNR